MPKFRLFKIYVKYCSVDYYDNKLIVCTLYTRCAVINVTIYESLLANDSVTRIYVRARAYF